MLRILRNGYTGLIAQQIRLDTIANNIANVNTTGFKKQDVSFADLLYQQAGPAGRPVEAVSPATTREGGGVQVAAVPRDFSQAVVVGTIQLDDVDTGRTLDLAVEGEGFFCVELPGGGYAFTRSGNFHLDASGRLINENGYALSPSFTLPPEDYSILVCPDGTIKAKSENSSEAAGQINLYRFVNPAGLEAKGDNLYLPTLASGQPEEGRPGEAGMGSLRQGCLEASNVDLASEMAGLIETQRAYEVSLRLVSSADEMWRMANDLHK